MALSPEEIEWLKEAQMPMTMEEKSDADINSLRAYIGREEELSNFEITQEQVDTMWNEFGIRIQANKPKNLKK